MRLHPYLLAVMAFAAAAALAVMTAVFAVGTIETRSERAIKRLFVENGISWAEVRADGLLVELTGTAPGESARFRAVSLAGRVVDGGRLRDSLDITATSGLQAPRFSVELLRNDDGISVIGLVPASWDYAKKLEELQSLASDSDIVDMLENADFAIPDGWVDAVDFGLHALRLLPRSKISVSADLVSITAISDSAAEKQRFEADLARARPAGIEASISISAPRPVIAPFILRFVIDENGARFDACSADTPRASSRIVSAAQAAGLAAGARCTLGLGAPSPRWAEASIAVIRALAELGAGVVTISDVDVTLIAAETVTQENFEKVVGELTTALPDVFSLKATLTPRVDTSATEVAAQFTATLSPEGQLQLRGRLLDERMREMIEAYAKARFGAGSVYVAARLDENVPATWGVRVLAGLGSLAQLGNGSLLVQEDRLVVRGVTGHQGARQEISRLLSEQLGQGAVFTVDVRYDERLDPTLGLPGPQECVRFANEVLDKGKISFAPGAAEIAADARDSLIKLAEILADCGGYPIEIGGHTDSQGRAETNLALSQQRAEAVLRELDALDVPVEAMVARGYGQAEPIADNGTEAGREANRRIAFRLLAQDDAAAPDLIATEGETDRAPDEVAPLPEGEAAPPPATMPDPEGQDDPTPEAPSETVAPDGIDNATLDWVDTPEAATPRPPRRAAER